MSDFKNDIINALERSLVGKVGVDCAAVVSQELIQILKPYEITKAETSLIEYSAINETILNNYCASLLIEGKSAKTVSQYKRTAEKLAEATKQYFTEMTVSDIRLFLAMQRANGVSDRTVENTRANLSAFFQWLSREGYVNKNPCANIPPIKYTEKIRLPFSPVEIDALRLACKNDKERAIIELLLSSGVRVSELTDLTVSDINFENLSVMIRKGKGGKSRTTYMSDLAKKHLLKYLMSRKIVGGYLFYNKKRDKLNPGGVRFILNQIAERANVENVHPHRFRRTFATGLARRGMELQEIRKLLGHSNINTTLEYVFTSDEQTEISYRKFIA